tara:strand:- start:1286 stop:1735 length:450 start_codon:yes stop_codon:yes gene_type:complete
MAEKKISQLTAKGSNLEETDLFIISKSDGSGGYDTKYLSGAELKSFTVNTQTDHYTFVLTDANKLVEFNHSGTKTFSLPLSGTANFPIGTEIKLAQKGTGQLRIAALAGTGAQSLLSSGGKTKIAAQYGVATLIKRSTDEWYLYGDLTT